MKRFISEEARKQNDIRSGRTGKSGSLAGANRKSMTCCTPDAGMLDCASRANKLGACPSLDIES